MRKKLFDPIVNFFRNCGEELISNFVSPEKFFIHSVSEGKNSPPVVRRNRKQYYRYMDFFYSPRPINRLSTYESRILCDLRLDHFDQVVDTKLNESVMNFFIHKLPKDGDVSILDFGCGNGVYTSFVKQRIPSAAVSGVDISSKAIERAQSAFHDIQWYHIQENSKLPFKDKAFRAVISSFVMHFNVSQNLLGEIHRTLKDDGIFIFNIYNQKYLSKTLFAKMRTARFEISSINNSELNNDHLFFVAVKKKQ